ncbi:HNH endonuclease family protein [Candidatus Avelusimicrobium alvi]|uniref:HNH endonuclease family protein n=1 Tax=Candidatus Avelusimicrobium alvi TaxID=3416221 RepID=UPI003D106ECD
MNITLKEITVDDLVKDYQDLAENGVTGYGGKLDIRPPYQREFIYKDKQREAVIDTVSKNFPLNVMYWAVRPDGGLEVIDGQQRTISICQYVKGDFAFNMLYFHNLPADRQEEILNYKLMVYFCEGTDSEKLEWFKTINIAGEELTEQELRNAVYHGSWVYDAKRYFSKTGCPAYGLAGDYLLGSAIRQDYLETALWWMSKGNIDIYMANHQHDPNASELWLYFQNVINWVKVTFPVYRKEMKGIEWGYLFNEFGKKAFDAKKLEKEIAALMQDDDVTNKKGIYAYVLDGKEKHLNIRAFTPTQKRKMYEEQKGVCPYCKKHFELSEMEADHITPWHEGGKTELSNGQMLCKDCNRRKSGK